MVSLGRDEMTTGGVAELVRECIHARDRDGALEAEVGKDGPCTS